MKKLLLLLLICFLTGQVGAQTALNGPFVGAVKKDQARLYIRTDVATPVTVLVSTASDFSGALTFTGATDANIDNAATINLTGLTPDTKYYYKVQVNGSDISSAQSFMTFPLESASPTFNFVFGSCQDYTGNPQSEPIFTQMKSENPRFFLQCGDWGYPDTTEQYPDDSNFFALDYNRVIETYRSRYRGTVKELMATTPFDYIYDDHDYMNDNASETSSSRYQGAVFTEVKFPPSGRRNSIDAYTKFFPHYDLVDTTQGIYHSFRFGNVEVFMLDNRSKRSPNLNSIRDTTGNILVFDPPAGHSILGQTQMNWLLNGLKNSTATWKFIVGGVSFNKGYRRVIDQVSGNEQLQNFDPTPFLPPGVDGNVKNVLGAIIDTWAGFPEDQNKVLQTIADNEIKNVVFLSSDSHTSAIDDGENAGIPELMAGNLNIANSRLAQFMSQVKDLAPLIGIPIEQDLNVWNAGAQGVNNSNLNNAYGKVEVFGNDSVRLKVIDQSGVLVASLTLCANGDCDTTITGIQKPYRKPHPISLYPNPAQNRLTVKIEKDKAVEPNANLLIYDALGRLWKNVPSSFELNNGEQIIDISDLKSGLYYVIVRQGSGNIIKSFQKQ